VNDITTWSPIFTIRRLWRIGSSQVSLEMINGDFDNPPLPQGRNRGIVGSSLAMKKLYWQVQKASQGMYPVLITGETGTGKELVARSVHFEGPRQNGPFVPVDCPAIQSTVFESELFGHVRGAFTGAIHTTTGLVASANGGTLFLDEIGDLPVNEQTKLLRVLQDKSVRPVGSTHSVPLNLRIISATNCDLEVALKNNAFRHDLFFRLNVFQIHVPSLRDRRGDVLLLARYFIEKFADPSVGNWTISEEALKCIAAYDWPGNVRELEHVVEGAVALCSQSTVQVDDLPSCVRNCACGQTADVDHALNIKEHTRRLVSTALGETHGDKLAAARLLGIGKTTLYRKLKLDKTIGAQRYKETA
jgi:DNA-binding NtrC family response regulator